METIANLYKEFKPTKEPAATPDPNNWNIKAATDKNPNKENVIILTPAVFENHITGINEIPELTQAIESYIEYDLNEYFYYNQLQLIESDINVYLTSNYRHKDFKDNLRLELQEEYNPLYNNMDGNEFYYFKTVNTNCSGCSVEGEALEFLTWHILNEYANGKTWKDTLTDQDILYVLSYQDPAHREIIRQTNKELLEDIKTTYEKLIKDLISESQEALQDIYYEKLYYPALEAAEQYIWETYINTPIKDVI